MTHRHSLTEEIPEAPDTPTEQMTRLEKRLMVGADLIDRRKQAGLEVSALSEYWMTMLHQYRDLVLNQPQKE